MKTSDLVSMPRKGKITVTEDDAGDFWLEVDNGEESIEIRLTRTSIVNLGRIFCDFAEKGQVKDLAVTAEIQLNPFPKGSP